MRICLLTDQDLDGGLAEGDWPCDPRPFLPDAEWKLGVLAYETAVPQVIRLARDGIDLFFNLCDGAWDEGRPGIEVVQTLERLEIPFTGAASDFFEPSRETMKRVCRTWGVDTPAYVIGNGERDLERAAETLTFPLFVKHPSSYASVGLTRDSRVETVDALFEQGRRMLETHGGVLVEEYIDGTECAVLVAENPEDPANPITYPPLRYEFPEGESFKHENVKWVDYHDLRSFPVEDPDLADRLREAAARFFAGLNGSGYGRCDIRVDAEGRAFMLEINPNCGLYYPPSDPGTADLILLQEPGGHETFTRHIVRAALRRHERRARAWHVRAHANGDYGLHASRPIVVGERVLAFEEQPHELVSLSYVEKHWNGVRRSRFDRYAWPLTDEIWVIWSRDPEGWKPINHSCEPTAWLEGLDVVARLPLAQGDEITLDYATLYNERMPSFECACGVPNCRGTIRGDDYLKEFVTRYGEHVSDFVRRKRREVL